MLTHRNSSLLGERGRAATIRETTASRRSHDKGLPQEHEGFDILVNGENRLFADFQLSAIASAGFHKEHYPEDTVQIRNRDRGSWIAMRWLRPDEAVCYRTP